MSGAVEVPSLCTLTTRALWGTCAMSSFMVWGCSTNTLVQTEINTSPSNGQVSRQVKAECLMCTSVLQLCCRDLILLLGKEGNFAINPGNTLNLPYDYGSIMHYGP